jgi:predicted porin
MKKSLIALAAVAASGFAMAQSSVTLFGVVDAAVTHYNGEQNWNGMTTGGNSTSRLGFRGVEDLGGGLKAQFWLEGAIQNDDGTAAGGGASGPGFEFKRRSTVSLLGNFGEVRLGRSTTAAYDAVSRYDVFGTVGVGSAQHWDLVRVSNMVSYYSPSFSGFKAGINYGFGEQAGDNRASRYVGVGATYDNGPISAGLGYDRLNRANVLGADRTAWSLGGSYNFNVVKLAAAYNQETYKVVSGAKAKDKGYYVGLSAPVGAAGEAKLSYNRYETDAFRINGRDKADQLALGYVHNLSKRTAVYGTYAYIKNKDSNVAVMGLNGSKVDVKSNGKQQAIQVGVRHSF